jgi:hypothetical protein
MAVARAQVGGGMNGTKIALIVFVVLTVASLTFTVIMFTQQSDMEARAADDKRAADSANTAAQQARGQLAAMVHRVLGESIEDPAKIDDRLKAAMEPFQKDQRLSKEIPADASVLTTLQGLYKLYGAASDQLAKASAERDDLSKQLTSLTETSTAREKKFAETSDQLQKQYQAMEQQMTANRDAWNQQVEDLKKKLEGSTNTAAQQLASERQTRLKLEKGLEQEGQRVKELVGTLASYRPNGDRLSLLQSADGTIVRALPGENIVYISLGAKDRVKPGLTFAVYSSTRGIPESGKGKATIEVTSVFDTTSEARVTSTTPGDPIVENDIIANPVYDRRRQFNFAVAGDFDLNFDGKVEDPGGQRVRQLIERWGGNIVNTVDTRTDFVVLGAPPPEPPKASATDDDAIRLRAAEMEKARAAFDAIKAQAQALSIPILTRAQFLHFLGTTVPKNADAENDMKGPVTKAAPAKAPL